MELVSTTSVPFELESLVKAKKYQTWMLEQVTPYLGNRILEFGAGIGAMSQILPLREKLYISEAEAGLLHMLQVRVKERVDFDPERIKFFQAILPSEKLDLLAEEQLDTVISFNVIEHIEDDKQTLKDVVSLLTKAGKGKKRIINFVPAQAWAYGSFDKNFGHFRRYSKSRIQEISREVAPNAKLILKGMNIVGLAGWWAQSCLFSKQEIGASSIQAFETLIPLVKPFDNFLFGSLGWPIGQSYIWVLEWENK